MKIVVKVGTQSILSTDGTSLESVMMHLVEQLVALRRAGHEVVLVSSGAVASGRKVARDVLGRQYGSSIGEKQVLASVGQHELIHVYAHILKQYGMLASQLLLTKHDFQTRLHYLNIARLLREILNHDHILPIINENDSVAIEELMFTDNDELAGLIAAQVNADKLIILSNVEGVLSRHPDDPNAELISEIHPDRNWPEVSVHKSMHGRGGMMSKLGTAKKMSNLGIMTHIASIKQPFILKRLLDGERVGSTIFPRKRKSSIKKWMDFSFEKKQGFIVINSCLFDILRENKKIVSILPIGVTSVSGTFQKGDLVEIHSPEHKKIGLGIAKYDSMRLQHYLGQKGKPIFVHYDHLQIF